MNILEFKRKALGHHLLGGDGPSGPSSPSEGGAGVTMGSAAGTIGNDVEMGAVTGGATTSTTSTAPTGPSVDAGWGSNDPLGTPDAPPADDVTGVDAAVAAQLASPPPDTLSPEETEAALEQTSNTAVLASRPDLPSQYNGSSWDYDVFDPGVREAIFDMTNPRDGGFLSDLGIRGAGMSPEQYLDTETPEQQATRMEAVSQLASMIGSAAMPTSASMAIALARALESGQGFGGIVGGMVGSRTGVPMGGSIGSLIGRSIENNAPPSLDAIAGIVGGYAGGKVGGGWGAQLGSYMASRGAKEMGMNWGNSLDISSPKAETNVGGVSKGKTGNGGSEAGFNGWTGADVGGTRGVVPVAVGGAR